MILWWIGNIVFVAVIIPVVVLLLHRLRAPVKEIRAYAEDALEHGVLAIAHLDAVDELLVTRDRIRTLKEQVAGYGATVARILG